ncbi:TPA: hypothetical protein DDW35_01625 [Candidatus Sumerlaeota bacterium]|jgi:uncharacterized membrane protein|nr:hypothetical protein [Candidatus Sumerlaeota bacterium]
MLKNFRIETLFLFLALCVGVVLALGFPPFQVEDEGPHFYRTYALSEGVVFPQTDASKPGYLGAVLPKSLYDIVYYPAFSQVTAAPNQRIAWQDLWGAFSVPLAPADRASLQYAGVAFYPPFSYAAPAVTVGVGRLFSLPPLSLLYLGRLACGALWLLMIYQALRLVPRQALVLALLALFPLTISQGWALTADSFSTALSFLVIAAFLRCAHGPEERLSRKQLILLFSLCALLTLSKQAYFLLYLLFWLIPSFKLGGTRRAYLLFALLTLVVFAPLGIWSFLTVSDMGNWVPGVDPKAQMHFILTHPFEYLWIFLRTLSNETSAAKLLGRLGWEDAPLPEILVWFHLILPLIAAWTAPTENENGINWRDRSILWGVLALSILLLGTLLFMQWNTVGHSAIRGLQRGRYYLPLLPLAFIPLQGLRPKGASGYVLLAGGGTMMALYCLAKRYYL